MTYLDKILFVHREVAKEDSRSLDKLIEKAQQVEAPRSFIGALRSSNSDGSLAVISEIKRKSPSKGEFERSKALESIDSWANTYEEGGASCLSVLTDKLFFGGSIQDLQKAKAATTLPVLRKDFTISPKNIVDARHIGADAVLLIVAALDDSELKDFYDLTLELGMNALVETHDEKEVEKALGLGCEMIGINQRDLETFEVDTSRALRVGQMIPDGVIRIAESGINGPGDAASLREGGFHAVLVGESLVTSSDPAKAIKELRQA